MSQETQEQVGYELELTDEELQPLGSGSTRPLGVVKNVEFHFEGKPKTYKETFYVFQDNRFDVLIGREFIDRHNALCRNHDVYYVQKTSK
jgi:hypothetical protein